MISMNHNAGSAIRTFPFSSFYFLLAFLRCDVANEFQLRERRKFFYGQAPDDQLGGLRIKHDLETELLELRDCLLGFIP